MRQAHSEGITNICFDDDGNFIASSGGDGEVKIFSGFDDDDPIVHKIRDVIYALAIKNERLYVSNDMNAIQSYTIIDGMNDGVMLRFTAPSHCLIFNKSGNILIAGSSDSTLKSLNLETKIYRLYEGHLAPVLSVALHSNENIMASSSCDGNVRIWDFNSQKCLKVINCLSKSNSYENSKTLARLAFCHSKKALIIPCEQSLKFYSIESWNIVLEIKKPFIDQVVTIVSISPDEKYLASTTDNYLFVFDTETIEIIKSEKIKTTISGISWHPQSNKFVSADMKGQIFVTTLDLKNPKPTQMSELFMDNDDDFIMSGMNNKFVNIITNNESVTNHRRNFMEPVQDTISIVSKIEPLVDTVSMDDLIEEDSDVGGIPGIDIDGEEERDRDNLRPGGKKVSPMVYNEDILNDNFSFDNVLAPSIVQKPSWEPTPMQAAFQPSATPISYSRFMLWNEVGRIIQYDTENEQTINVEFHDSSVHHAIHINNTTYNYTLAALNANVLVLANTSTDDVPSQLFCMHFSSWDLTKEWCLTLPQIEDVTNIAIGDEWIAVATSTYNVRIFSYGGLQKEIISIAGPVVCMAAHFDMLIIVYHNALAIIGDQCLSYEFLCVPKKKHIDSNRLPISSKATLKWMGFSCEGTPFTVDSTSIVRIYNRSFANTWTGVANLKDFIKSPSDNFWVVSIREEPQQIRAIFCKSSKYPAVLPPPVIQILPFKLAMCEPTTEKSILEENFLRSTIFSEHYKFLKEENIEFYKEEKEIASNDQQEYLMKLFALACRNKKIYRAFEIVVMLPTARSVQLAGKYAIQKGEMHLAKKIEEVAISKVERENLENLTHRNSFLQSKLTVNSSDQFNAISNDMTSVVNPTNEASQDNIKIDSLLQWKPKDANSKPLSNMSLSSSQTSKLIKNPFRIIASDIKSTAQVGSIIFDTIEVSKKTPKVVAADILMPKKISIEQKKLFSTNSSSMIDKDYFECKSSQSGFEIWYGENKSYIAETNPNIADDELIIIAAKSFKSLAKHLQKEYDDKAKSSMNPAEDKKRKLENENLNFSTDKKLKNV